MNKTLNMKSFALLTTLAASAAATGFRDANPFQCPANTDNKCTPKQGGGYDFADLPEGDFSDYNGFNWKGFKCQNGFGKRGAFDRRTDQKVIGATCGSDKSKAPTFGCNGKDVDKFSLSEIHVSVEFDCDLEFHYDMPDGSQCKHRSACSTKGTKVKNDQCGGAKNVTIVYPTQPKKPKQSCSIGVHSMSFDCQPPSSTKPPVTKTTPPATKPTTTYVPTTKPDTPTTKPDTPTTKPTSKPEVSSSSYTPEKPPSSYSSVITTSYLTTSTIFTTSISTITTCSRNVTNCPAGGIYTTVVTVGSSTTVCPVTTTTTLPATYTPVPPPASQETSTYVPTETKPTETLPGTTTKPNSPVETLPCPSVVPQCLNTFLFQLACSDNTDHACYCPNEVFITQVFSCIYAHGETDTIISQAVVFLQGLCGSYVPQNPTIALPSVTSYITPTVTVSVPAVYTTATVVVTQTVPCTDSAGNTIPSSYSTITTSTALTYPQVGFQTGPSGGVGVIPITTPLQAGVSTPAGGAGAGAGAGAATSVSKPTGTGAYTPSKPTGVTVSGAERHGAFALAGALVMAVVAML